MKLAEDEVELPDGTVVPYLRDAQTNQQSVSLLCLKDNQVLLQQEYSYPPDEVMYQLPGGTVEAGETPEAAARRELVEESGYRAGQLEEIGTYYLNNRRSDAKMHVFLATNLTEVKKSGGDIEEVIDSEWVSLPELKKMIASGQIVNFSILTAWSLYQSWQ